MHSVICHSPAGSAVAEDAEVDVDMHDGGADVTVSGTVGLRTTSVLRTVFEALDGASGPVSLDCSTAHGASDSVRDIVDDARVRRRRRGLAGISVVASRDRSRH